MSQNYIQFGRLKVAQQLADLVSNDVLDGLDFKPEQIWDAFDKIINTLGPRNRDLLALREELQSKIDKWHVDHAGQQIDQDEYKAFLKDIGYLVEEGADFSIQTQNVDPEIASLAGPQLVVPVMNARFALNAANARWGSLYDALYGTDVVPTDGELAAGKAYNAMRGDAVIAQAVKFLDEAAPLQGASHKDVTDYETSGASLTAKLSNGQSVELVKPEQFVGTRDIDGARSILIKNNGLHFEIIIDKSDPIGSQSGAGVKDINVESALTAIQDCEDSVAAVDAEDKAIVYGNWLGLMKANLTSEFMKGSKKMVRALNPDLEFAGSSGQSISLAGRSLLLVRNVGHLMTIDAVLDQDGNEVPEGMLDALITVLCAMHDLKKDSGIRNSRHGSIYIVKPKMHGPDEVKLANDLFNMVEDALGLDRNTIKIGVMDEERRTTVNLKECIRAVKDRIVFINTGFLDRTGDEIHTSMKAGPVLPKAAIKAEPWLSAYEDWNVDTGLETGFSGNAQIGKGMWAMPDEMAKMVAAKIEHLEAGANCAWVPSPTAATLHAMHYHQLNVFDRQKELATRPKASLTDILTPPLMGGKNLSSDEVTAELENNAQGILGYVVRWVEHGVGCSKVPDIHDVGLMEDRATLRISSQHIANWLEHGLVSEDQVMAAMKKMAKIVDAQNANDSNYRPMAANFDASIAFAAACDLVFKGVNQPSGYTEPILHARRKQAKASA
ncbi:malate synthase G [Maritalea sp.]|uniref:malate synthase G n=1 Tax=Maritalea sp. TaxID=2003361 RepID=UPI003EF94A36